MNNANGGQSCSVKCWTVAGVIGVIIALMAIAVAGKSIFAGLILGILAAVLLGFLFNWLFCSDVPAIGASSSSSQASDGDGQGTGVASAAGVTAAGASAAKAASVTSGQPAASATATAAPASEDTTAAKSDESEADAVEVTGASDIAGEATGAVKPSKALAGEADLAERKGEWSYDGDADGDASDVDAGAKGETASADKPAASESTGDDNATPAADEAADASDAGADTTETVIKPSTELPGQADLASRKGEWRYNGGDKAEADSSSPVAEPDVEATPATTEDPAVAVSQGASAAPATETAPKAEATPKDLGEDYDGDGVKEGTEEGSKPELLEAPLEGGPDNLKEIKGIGPKLEKVCHSLGVYHFSQIAAWTEDEVAWANANLVGFKGRVTRDNWVEQAKILAAGGETEFSKRVDKGGVY